MATQGHLLAIGVPPFMPHIFVRLIEACTNAAYNDGLADLLHSRTSRHFALSYRDSLFPWSNTVGCQDLVMVARLFYTAVLSTTSVLPSYVGEV